MKSRATTIWSFYLHAILGGLSVLPGLNGVFPSFFSWLENGVPLDPLDASWGTLMALGAVDGRPTNIVPPRVFRKTELRRIGVPTLLLVGDKEVIYEPYATLTRAVQTMPGLEAEIVPGANHVAAMTRPDDVNDRIIQFFQRRRGTSPDGVTQSTDVFNDADNSERL